ncbi:histidine decarboxylase [Aeromonas bivalvium]|uniref:histidine decarboxylase n=1 Tax=Aeromonas bivalvium TaxID=440079 RepID=UPI0038D13DBF
MAQDAYCQTTPSNMQDFCIATVMDMIMGLSSEDARKIESFWQYCVQHQYFNVGYPEAADFDYSALNRFLSFSINNCGDWSQQSNYLLNSFDFEREVIQFFAALFCIPAELGWGYVTNGGTEGNMFGCYLARELFPEATLYYSKETHYSVAKIIRLLRMKSSMVDSQPNGEMDYDDLIKRIRLDGERHPIIFANIGTTMKGAVDNIATIQDRLRNIGLARRDYYLHADAALSGMILPFIDNPQPFSFADGIDSISVSGHKMIGSPIPCGVVLARKKYVEHISVDVDYISASDQTISGSRNGYTPLLLWMAIKSRTMSDWRQRTQHCLDMAQYVIERFHAKGIHAWRNPNSITVVFPKPADHIWQKHCLATSGKISHIITMPHHSGRETLDRVINDIALESAPGHGLVPALAV